MTAPRPRKPPRKTSSRGTGPRTSPPGNDHRTGPGAGAGSGTGSAVGAGIVGGRNSSQNHFATPDGIRTGAVLYDRGHDMPGRVREVDGRLVVMERPTGFVWRVHFWRLRPATDREVRQLAALGRLHRLRLRGLAEA